MDLDTISASIVTAVASGLAQTGKQAVLDTYSALKNALKSTFGTDSDVVEAVDRLEEQPDSQGRQLILQEEIATAGAIDNQQLIELAQALLHAVNDTPQGQATMKQFNINAKNIGIAGDDAHVEGGQHFH